MVEPDLDRHAVHVLVLCARAPRTAYALKRALRFHRISSAQAQRDKLLERGLLRCLESKTGRHERPCVTTILGMVHLLVAKDPPLEWIARIAKNHSQLLPHVFGNWQHLSVFEAPAFLRSSDPQNRPDAIVSRALVSACREFLEAPPRRVRFIFDTGEFKKVRSRWSKSPLSSVYPTVDDYVEEVLREFLEPRALLLDDLLYSSIGASPLWHRRTTSDALERNLLCFTISANPDLCAFSRNYFWQQRLEAIQEVKDTERAEVRILARDEEPQSMRAAFPSLEEILRWEHHCIQQHGYIPFIASWSGKGIRREYAKPEDIRICPKCHACLADAEAPAST